MKRYYNDKTKEWYTEGQNITRNLGSGVFAGVPSVEQLTEWGFVEWIEPEPTPEELLERAKVAKLAEIDAYNSSDAVDSFTIGGKQMWLTRDERTQIDESINAYEATGATSMTKYFGGVPYTFTLVLWKQMLNALIVYASEALNVTEAHKVAIGALTTVEDVEAYDFTIGYPTKPAFGHELS